MDTMRSTRGATEAAEGLARHEVYVVAFVAEEGVKRRELGPAAEELWGELALEDVDARARVLQRRADSVVADENAVRDNIRIQEIRNRTPLLDAFCVDGWKISCAALMQQEAADRQLLTADEYLSREGIWFEDIHDYYRCRAAELARVEANARKGVVLHEAVARRQLHAAAVDLREHLLAEANAKARAALSAMEAVERRRVIAGEAASRDDLRTAARLSSLRVQLLLVPRKEAQLRASLMDMRESEMAQFVAASRADMQRAARASVERRETARRRALATAEATTSNRLSESGLADRHIAEVTVAYRTNEQQSIGAALPPAVLRRLQCLLEEEEDERELVLLDEVRVRRKRLPSTATSICGSQGDVESVHASGLPPDIRPRVTRDRNRGNVSNDALQRWVRFNR
ncbi:hypothetical protein ABB37_00037 [Leptomonas pyrrhocoris]|uniref:Uncharacterized protein n=1 Tax=Leptomonas pyrrhocoris TaxID=157538 RepID=A0A0N0DZT1_LEPPY|nr:hypothetical protein ABB37_00037 [Leptomonas pyrrhocoris]KPA85635.1 hypothetical protein ABB37_00037 [Leptomonas pyrrhocoris]|eukprot:XP_015664074.1 hypothetical protein ABB37_00037 [Leptomonas pyrrhocoris]